MLHQTILMAILTPNEPVSVIVLMNDPERMIPNECDPGQRIVLSLRRVKGRLMKSQYRRQVDVRGFSFALLLSALISLPAFAGSEVGDTAPELKPKGWFNMESGTTWQDLEGKLILIEKWATW